MEKKIRIKAGNVEAEAVLNESSTADKIWAALPLEARANTWGDEIYFDIPVKSSLEKEAKEVVSRFAFFLVQPLRAREKRSEQPAR